MAATPALIALLGVCIPVVKPPAAITCANARLASELGSTVATAGGSFGGEEKTRAVPQEGGDGRAFADHGFGPEDLSFHDKTASGDDSPPQDERTVAATVQGLVTDVRTHRPIAGARVSLEWGRVQGDLNALSREPIASALTDERGRFRLDRVEPGVYRLTAAGLGYVPSPFLIVELEAGKSTMRVIELDPLAKFSGRVLDESNRPVNGAKVSMEFGSRQPSAALRRLLREQGRSSLTTTTEREGEFELFAPAEEENITLVALTRGYIPSRLGPLPPEAGRARMGILLRLSRGLVARGRVVNEDGMPIPDAVVLAHHPGLGEVGLELRDKEPQAKSGLDGRFVLQGLEKANYKLKVSHDSYASRLVQKVEIQLRTANFLPDIVLPPAEQIRGRVADTDGQPISGARISAVSGEVNSSEATSDDKGLFVLSGFTLGASVRISAAAVGHSEASKIVSAPDRDVVIVLPRHGMLRGRVEEAQTLTPLRAFQIRIGIGSKGKTFHSEDGNFEWKELPPGRWNFVAQAPGYQPAEITDLEIRAGEPTEVMVFSLTKGVELAGRVVDAATGDGLPDVAVNYHDGTEVKSAEWHFYANANGQRTDPDGNFRFDGLPPGRVTIIAKSPLHAEAQRTVVAGTESFVEIKLSQGDFVSGRVVGSDMITPASGARVSLLSAADMSGVTLPTDENGAFSFAGLAPGRYRLSAETRLGQTKSQEIVLRENERLKNLLLVVRAGATIQGKVTGLRPNEPPVVEIVAQAPGDFIGTASTAPDGTFAIHGVPNGRVEVTAQTYSQRRISKSVEIPEGALELSLDIEFPSAARLSGRVTRGGQPVAYEFVKASPRDPESAAGSGKTDGNGIYNIDGLSKGNYDISLSGAATKSLRVSGNTVLDIELPALSLSGRVLEVNSGQPLSGATVEVQQFGLAVNAGSSRIANTDTVGRFFVEGMEPGEYQLVAHKRGFKVSTETASLPASSEIVLSLTLADGIAIRVRDGISGLALRAATVDAFSGASSVHLSVALDETGSGELPQLAPGRYNLLVSSEGYAAKSVNGWTVPGSPLDLFLTTGGRLEIQADSAHIGAKASLVEANGVPTGPAQREFTLSPLIVLPNLAAGEYILRVKLPEQTKTYKASISEGQTTVLLVK